MNIFVFLFLYAISKVEGIHKLSDCKAKLDDGSIIDLTSLDNPTNPRQYVDARKGDIYKYNPCSPIACRLGTKTAVICQTSQSVSYVLGQQKNVNFEEDPEASVAMVFTGGDDGRSVYIKCKCGQSESFRFENSNDAAKTYVCCC